MIYGYGNEWYARGCVCNIEPSEHTIEIKRFEAGKVFGSTTGV